METRIVKTKMPKRPGKCSTCRGAMFVPDPTKDPEPGGQWHQAVPCPECNPRDLNPTK